jgi:HAD superfamily hydrolase (TIGR01450 family)
MNKQKTDPKPSFINWLTKNKSNYDALILDIDGVLIRAGKSLPGAPELISMFRAENIPFSLLTNDACTPMEIRLSKLSKNNMNFKVSEIVSSGHVLKVIVEEHRLKGQLFLVLGNLGDPCYAEQAGLKVTRDLGILSKCAGVIVGEANYDWETSFNAIINYFINNPAALFLIPNPDIFFPVKDGGVSLGSGGVGIFIKNVLNTKGIDINPKYLGKPHQPIFDYHHHQMEKRLEKYIDKNRVLMVGDSLQGDICGANEYGYDSAFILTGINKIEDLKSCPSKPDFIFRNL